MSGPSGLDRHLAAGAEQILCALRVLLREAREGDVPGADLDARVQPAAVDAAEPSTSAEFPSSSSPAADGPMCGFVACNLVIEAGTMATGSDAGAMKRSVSERLR